MTYPPAFRSKELKDCETPGRQIAHIRKILLDLGMSGRMSMEQAKTIREKRELAQEISEVTSARDFTSVSDFVFTETDDVISFEQEKGLTASSRASRSKQQKTSGAKRKVIVDSDDEASAEGDEEEGSGKKPRVRWCPTYRSLTESHCQLDRGRQAEASCPFWRTKVVMRNDADVTGPQIFSSQSHNPTVILCVEHIFV